MRLLLNPNYSSALSIYVLLHTYSATPCATAAFTSNLPTSVSKRKAAFLPPQATIPKVAEAFTVMSTCSTATVTAATVTAATVTATDLVDVDDLLLTTTKAPPPITTTTTTTPTTTTTTPPLTLNDNGSLTLSNGNILLDGFQPTQWQSVAVVEDTDTCTSSKTIDSMFLQASNFRSDTPVSIGTLQNCKHVLAVSRLTKYWMGPSFDLDVLPLDTQFLLVETTTSNDDDDDDPQQSYALVLPLVHAGYRAALQTNPKTGEVDIICSAENGNDQSMLVDSPKALYVATGNDPFALLQQGFAQVADELQTFRPLSEKILPDTVNDFGWCTWDAFYSKVDPKGILEGVQSLRDQGVPPRTLILDDGWQQVSPTAPEATAAVAITDDDDESIASIVQGAMMGVVITVFAYVYETFVKRAAHGSIPNRLWNAASHTILKGGFWFFFDAETDFGRQLNGVDANDKFESTDGISTLKDLVSTLKNEMGLNRVYCWHALHGYWRGVSSELGDKLGIDVWQVNPTTSEHLLKVQPELSWDPVSLFGVGMITTQTDIDKFYKHIHEPLVEAGVDGVKIDVQSGVTAVGADVGEGGPHLARMYNNAMENSVAERFTSDNGGIDCINCMCHSTENLYRYHATSVARASEDFFPDRSDSQTVHIVNVAYNSLFLGEICLPDWDMFHSLHEYAPLHAAARAVGGCPVYVSDKPGRHDADLLRKLVMPDGSVLRANLPGRPTRDCLFANVGTDKVSALKIWNQNNVGGVVGAFHVQGVEWNFDTHENEVVEENPGPLIATVTPKDVESLRGKEGPFCAWRHQSTTLEFLENDSSEMKAELNHREWEIFSIVPVQTTGDVMWGPIGLANMLNSGGGLLHADEPLEQTTTITADGLTATATAAGLSARGPGLFVGYCQPAPSRVLFDGTTVTELQFDHDEQTGKLSFNLPDENSQGDAHRLTVVWDQLD